MATPDHDPRLRAFLSPYGRRQTEVPLKLADRGIAILPKEQLAPIVVRHPRVFWALARAKCEQIQVLAATPSGVRVVSHRDPRLNHTLGSVTHPAHHLVARILPEIAVPYVYALAPKRERGSAFGVEAPRVLVPIARRLRIERSLQLSAPARVEYLVQVQRDAQIEV